MQLKARRKEENERTARKIKSRDEAAAAEEEAKSRGEMKGLQGEPARGRLSALFAQLAMLIAIMLIYEGGDGDIHWAVTSYCVFRCRRRLSVLLYLFVSIIIITLLYRGGVDVWSRTSKTGARSGVKKRRISTHARSHGSWSSRQPSAGQPGGRDARRQLERGSAAAVR